MRYFSFNICHEHVCLFYFPALTCNVSLIKHHRNCASNVLLLTSYGHNENPTTKHITNVLL